MTYSENDINSHVLGDRIGPSNKPIEVGISGITYNIIISILLEEVLLFHLHCFARLIVCSKAKFEGSDPSTGTRIFLYIPLVPIT